MSENAQTSTALVQLSTLEPRNIVEARNVAEIFASSGLFPDAKSWAQALVKIMAGRELQLGAFASMQSIYFVNGKPAYSANLMAARVLQSGKYDYRVATITDDTCVIEFYKNGTLAGESSLTIQEARTAGMDKQPDGKPKQTWLRYPRNMLFARAMSNGVKWFCPDVFMQPVYTPDEFDAEIDESDPLVVDGSFTPRIVDNPENGNGQSHDPGKPLDQPWQEVIAGWKQKEWSKYWMEMKRRGLSQDEVHAALGVDHSKDFTGTRGDHNDRIKAAEKQKQAPDSEKPAQPKGKVTLEGDEGSFLAYSVQAKAVVGGLPQVIVHAMTSDGSADPLPVIDDQIELDVLRGWFADCPNRLPLDGINLFTFTPDGGLTLTVDWARIDGQHVTITDIRFD